MNTPAAQLGSETIPTVYRPRRGFEGNENSQCDVLNKQTSSIAGGPRRFLLVPAILGLCALASPRQSARAQTCGNLLSAGPVISPISGSKVVAGQTITITRYTVASAFGNCLFQNGVAFYADPSGAVTETLTNFSVAPGGQINCDGTPAGGDASCLLVASLVEQPKSMQERQMKSISLALPTATGLIRATPAARPARGAALRRSASSWCIRA